MKEYKTDVAIVGGGSAGLAAATVIKKAGFKALIIERDRELGGITLQCIHNGFGIHEFKEELTGPEFVQRFINKVKEKTSLKGKNLFHPVRVILTGRVSGPDLKETIKILGFDACKARIIHCYKKCKE